MTASLRQIERNQHLPGFLKGGALAGRPLLRMPWSHALRPNSKAQLASGFGCLRHDGRVGFLPFPSEGIGIGIGMAYHNHHAEGMKGMPTQ
jgi:hypothetical protein